MVEYLPIIIGVGLAFIVAGIIMLISWLMGPKRPYRTKLTPYESGMPILDASRKRIPVAFFLIALDFVVFDVESAFLFPWALTVRNSGTTEFISGITFIVVAVVVGYLYVYLKGGFDIYKGNSENVK